MAQDHALFLLNELLPRLQQSFANLPLHPGGRGNEEPSEDAPPLEAEVLSSMAAVLGEVSNRMADNYPYFHPLYAGQMLKPPHPVARAAYAMAMWINPNNHALDGGRASSRLEIEAVSEIAAMFGWPTHLGHLTSGGTFANLEALWVARQLHPGLRVVASSQAHYTHQRISAVLGLGFSSVAADARGCMDVDALEAELAQGRVGTVVVTLGTTAAGAVDPLDRILALRDRYPFRIHVDAAYGGYFKLASKLAEDAAHAFHCISHADSIVVDPHKHGLQPYGCGCILFHDPAVGRFYRHDSPYTYFTSDQLHLGEISLECSRAGAAAVALWATQRLLPLVPGGAFASQLDRSLSAAHALYQRLEASDDFITGLPPQLDIVVWAVAAPSIAESSRRAREIFDAAAKRDLHLALVQVPASSFGPHRWTESSPEAAVTCLRSVLMKPEHLDWMEEIWNRLHEAAHDSGTSRRPSDRSVV